MALGCAILFVGLALGAAYGSYECFRLERRRDATSRALLAASFVALAVAGFVWLPGSVDFLHRRYAIGFDRGWTCVSPKGDFCVKDTRP